jgi:hypothetical protein
MATPAEALRIRTLPKNRKSRNMARIALIPKVFRIFVGH